MLHVMASAARQREAEIHLGYLLGASSIQDPHDVDEGGEGWSEPLVRSPKVGVPPQHFARFAESCARTQHREAPGA